MGRQRANRTLPLPPTSLPERGMLGRNEGSTPMGRVPNWDEIHGWHEFQEGGSVMGGEGWCALCDWLREDHTPKPTPCDHSRLRSNALILRDRAGRPEAISLSVACHECGELFQFAGIETTSTVLVSEDRDEVRLLIEPQTQKAPQAEA